MKIFKILLMVAVVALFSSCEKENKKETVDISGEWRLVSDTDGVVEREEVDVYISFSEGTFELLQKSGTSMRYNRYYGVYTFAAGLLSGTYAGNKYWGSDYNVTFDGKDVMMMTAVGTELVCRYERAAIPQSVRDEAIDTKADAWGTGLL